VAGRFGTLAAVTRREVSVTDGPLTSTELQDVAVIAARAFHTDPFFEFLSPKAVSRARGLSLYWYAICANLGPRGRLLTARRDGRIIGVGAWIPPGAYPQPVATQIAQQLGALRALYRVPSALVTGLQYIVALDKAHPKEELWYLQLLATDPEHQRTGVGAALMHQTLETCDAEGVASYLETQNEDNLAYYGRFGYEVAKMLRPVRRGPPLWTMRRDPRGSEAG